MKIYYIDNDGLYREEYECWHIVTDKNFAGAIEYFMKDKYKDKIARYEITKADKGQQQFTAHWRITETGILWHEEYIIYAPQELVEGMVL